MTTWLPAPATSRLVREEDTSTRTHQFQKNFAFTPMIRNTLPALTANNKTANPLVLLTIQISCRLAELLVRIVQPHTPHPVERVKGIEPSSLAWKAMALPLSYTRKKPEKPANLFAPPTYSLRSKATSSWSMRLELESGRPPHNRLNRNDQMGGAGFEPAKALPSDLQSDPFDRSGSPPGTVVENPLSREPVRNTAPSTQLTGPLAILRKNKGFPLRASGGT